MAAGTVDGADLVVAYHQVALERRDLGMCVGQLLADGASLLMRGERLRGVAGMVLHPGDPVQALRHRRAAGSIIGLLTGKGLEKAPGAFVRGERSRGIAGRLLHVAHRDQAGARLELRLVAGARLAGQSQAQLEASPQGRERLGL